MKHLVITILAACVLAALPSLTAQDCSTYSSWDLRGTYTMSGIGWADLSKLNPAFPAGWGPYSYVGAINLDGTRAGTGWLALSLGGMQVTGQFANLTYQVRSDCSVVYTYTVKIKEMPVTLGPDTRIAVIGSAKPAPGTPDLELLFMTVGKGPGNPVDLGTSKRISMN